MAATLRHCGYNQDITCWIRRQLSSRRNGIPAAKIRRWKLELTKFLSLSSQILRCPILYVRLSCCQDVQTGIRRQIWQGQSRLSENVPEPSPLLPQYHFDGICR